MIDVHTLRQMALSLPETTEEPHFEKTSFRVNKKIFATFDAAANRVCLMLSPEDQSSFCTFDKNVIYPVPNKWGLKGATFAELSSIKEEMLQHALEVAYCKVAPARLSKPIIEKWQQLL
jgi:hypothetical protein